MALPPAHPPELQALMLPLVWIELRAVLVTFNPICVVIAPLSESAPEELTWKLPEEFWKVIPDPELLNVPGVVTFPNVTLEFVAIGWGVESWMVLMLATTATSSAVPMRSEEHTSELQS